MVLGFRSKKVDKMVYKQQTEKDPWPNMSCTQCFSNTRWSLLILCTVQFGNSLFQSSALTVYAIIIPPHVLRTKTKTTRCFAQTAAQISKGVISLDFYRHVFYLPWEVLTKSNVRLYLQYLLTC